MQILQLHDDLNLHNLNLQHQQNEVLIHETMIFLLREVRGLDLYETEHNDQHSQAQQEHSDECIQAQQVYVWK